MLKQTLFAKKAYLTAMGKRSEADACRMYVAEKLQVAGWSHDQIYEQEYITPGRIATKSPRPIRQRGLRVDYTLKYNRDLTLAVVEAKAAYRSPGAGLEQAKRYAQKMGLLFAYATNGHSIIEFDFTTGVERELESFPSPAELWSRFRVGCGLESDIHARQFLEPWRQGDEEQRYYQEIAVNQAVSRLLNGAKRCLLTLATGAGKTYIAFQICWKLWRSRWNAAGDQGRRARILYLSDMNVLVDDPKDKMFAPFGAARYKVEAAQEPNLAREMYFAIYQALARDKNKPGLYRKYPQDFFDLIVVDECHRGSADGESYWREILEYFEPAYQLGMTATPRHEDNRRTYEYFGKPLYTYSLGQGIEDGFLAPYRLVQALSSVDAFGFRPERDERDLRGRAIVDRLYQTRHFERLLSHEQRTLAIARHLVLWLDKRQGPQKTIVFCVNQEHAERMRHAIATLIPDRLKEYPDYVVRIVSDEGEVGREHLSNFTDPERLSPVIVTTAKMLAIGVDAPTVQNIVIARVINSMPEFKQIIGRGTRIDEERHKYFFTIIDYTGSASRLFADKEFDGEPDAVHIETIEANEVKGAAIADPSVDKRAIGKEPEEPYAVTGETVDIVDEKIINLGPDGAILPQGVISDDVGALVRWLAVDGKQLRMYWRTKNGRAAILEILAQADMSADMLQRFVDKDQTDTVDILCHLGFGERLLSRNERAELLRAQQMHIFERYGNDAIAILNSMISAYVLGGLSELWLPNIILLPEVKAHGNPMEIKEIFGGKDAIETAVEELSEALYNV